jgi:SAM-dependent methyltransferase
MIPLAGILRMVVREHLAPVTLVRTPEERPAMDAPSQACAWHAQGADDGPIVPLYHLNALACSRLAPLNSTVVDLGCGSGRYAVYLAKRRPDLRIVGFDLSPAMVDLGNAALRRAGLDDRVELRIGDMTRFAQAIPDGTRLINCLFAVHHLPDLDDVKRCFAQIREVRDRHGSAFWIFDLARPRDVRTAHDYPEVLTPDAPPVFRHDSTSSLVAAYSHAELRDAIERTIGKAVQRRHARLLPLYQAFWMNARTGLSPSDTPYAELGMVLAGAAREQYRALRLIMPGLPQ